MEAGAGMAKPIPTSRQGTDTSSKEIATTKTLATHTPNKQVTLTPHNPLRHNNPMQGDSNREATRVDTVKLRLQVAVALLIQLVQVRRAVVMVRSMLRATSGQGLMMTSRRK